MELRDIPEKDKHKYTHGYTYHPLYRRFYSMKTRCYNSNDPSYRRYGGRGIKICAEWLDSPANFIEWALAHGWKSELEIDRINNDGDYTPDNCRFVTRAINQRNRSDNKITEEIAELIRKKYKAGIRMKHLVLKFNLSRAAIYGIVTNKYWKTKDNHIEKNIGMDTGKRVSEADKTLIRKALEAGQTVSSVARTFNVSRNTVYRINNQPVEVRREG
jgi:Mor family transcriptional regulator